MGNFDVPFDKETFGNVADDVVRVSKSLHPDIFNEQIEIRSGEEERVRNYIDRILKRK